MSGWFGSLLAPFAPSSSSSSLPLGLHAGSWKIWWSQTAAKEHPLSANAALFERHAGALNIRFPASARGHGPGACFDLDKLMPAQPHPKPRIFAECRAARRPRAFRTEASRFGRRRSSLDFRHFDLCTVAMTSYMPLSSNVNDLDVTQVTKIPPAGMELRSPSAKLSPVAPGPGVTFG